MSPTPPIDELLTLIAAKVRWRECNPRDVSNETARARELDEAVEQYEAALDDYVRDVWREMRDRESSSS